MKRILFASLSLLLLACPPPRNAPGARSWVYQLQNADPARLASLAFDVVVMDYSRDGTDTGAYLPGEIQTLKDAGKTVLAYLSIGEAERYRFYWDPRWDTLPPAWLGPENPDWPGNYTVQYWDPAWQQLVLQYLHRILDQGFDGVYLDRVDAFEGWSDSLGEQEAAARMIHWIQRIADTARATDPEFIIIPQNGERLLDLDTAGILKETVSGWAVEDLWFVGTTAAPPLTTAERLRSLAPLSNGAYLLLSVDYVDDGTGYQGTNLSRIQLYYQKARTFGFLPYAAREDRALNVPNVIPGIQP